MDVDKARAICPEIMIQYVDAIAKLILMIAIKNDGVLLWTVGACQ